MLGPRARTAAALLNLAAEGCPYVFSVPGEETMDILDALGRQTAVQHVTTRHEQGAAFMADVYGRLTGRAAVAMATLGPGATNLVTGIADAYLDRAPMVALTGQAGSDATHKAAHQYVDIVRLLEPVTKWNQRVGGSARCPRSFARPFGSQLEKPGPTHIELPENLAAAVVDGTPAHSRPRRPTSPIPPTRPLPTLPGSWSDPAGRSCWPATGSSAGTPPRSCGTSPGGSTCRWRSRSWARSDRRPEPSLTAGRGAPGPRPRPVRVRPGGHRGGRGLRPRGVRPIRWNPDGRQRIVHIDTQPAEVDATYQPAVELIGDIGGTLRRLLAAVLPEGIGGRDADARHRARETLVHQDLRTALLAELRAFEADEGWPIQPQKALVDLRRALRPTDIVVSDVGAHKIWLARLYPTYEPNTVIISNGFAAMGIALPGAIAAKLVHPDRRVVALCGDGGSS